MASKAIYWQLWQVTTDTYRTLCKPVSLLGSSRYIGLLFFRVGCDRSKAASLHATLDLFLLRKNEEQRRDPVVQTKMLGGESKKRQVAVVLSKGEQTSSMLL